MKQIIGEVRRKGPRKGDRQVSSENPEISVKHTPDKTQLRTGMLARSLMGLPPLSEGELAKRAKFAEK